MSTLFSAWKEKDRGLLARLTNGCGACRALALSISQPLKASHTYTEIMRWMWKVLFWFILVCVFAVNASDLLSLLASPRDFWHPYARFAASVRKIRGRKPRKQWQRASHRAKGKEVALEAIKGGCDCRQHQIQLVWIQTKLIWNAHKVLSGSFNAWSH